MLKNFFLRILIITLLLTSFCSKISYKSTPGTGYSYYNSVLIRAKIIKSTQKDKVKILLKYNKNGDRLIFLGALNQVLFEILIHNSKTIIIISKKKKFWEGQFSQFMEKIWGINVDYPELKNLLLNKVIPEKTIAENSVKISIKKAEKKKIAWKVLISDKKTELEFKVYSQKKQIGNINFKRDLSRYQKINLEEFNYEKKTRKKPGNY